MTGSELYDAMAPVYRDYAARRANYLDAIDSFVAESIPPAAQRLLDVGSGDGIRAMALARACGIATVVLSDVSSEMVQRCRMLGATEVWHVPAQSLPDNGTRFDAITCLWNVLGHLAGHAERVAALRRMRDLLAPGGRLFLDVQNRHNASAYGWGRVLMRVGIDTMWPDERRGDTSFDWKVGDTTIRGRGHLFTPREIGKLLRQAGLEVVSRFTFDYSTGCRSTSVLLGQLVFVCRAGG
jgi:SAM-dependent methyltransferase